MRFAKQSKGKKNIAVLLVVAMLLTIMPVAAFAVDEEDWGVTIDPSATEVTTGSTVTFTATATTSSAVVWSSTGGTVTPSETTVDGNGVTSSSADVYFDTAGDYTVTAAFTAAEGGTVKEAVSNVKVTVPKEPAVVTPEMTQEQIQAAIDENNEIIFEEGQYDYNLNLTIDGKKTLHANGIVEFTGDKNTPDNQKNTLFDILENSELNIIAGKWDITGYCKPIYMSNAKMNISDSKVSISEAAYPSAIWIHGDGASEFNALNSEIDFSNNAANAFWLADNSTTAQIKINFENCNTKMNNNGKDNGGHGIWNQGDGDTNVDITINGGTFQANGNGWAGITLVNKWVDFNGYDYSYSNDSLAIINGAEVTMSENGTYGYNNGDLVMLGSKFIAENNVARDNIACANLDMRNSTIVANGAKGKGYGGAYWVFGNGFDIGGTICYIENSSITANDNLRAGLFAGYAVGDFSEINMPQPSIIIKDSDILTKNNGRIGCEFVNAVTLESSQIEASGNAVAGIHFNGGSNVLTDIDASSAEGVWDKRQYEKNDINNVSNLNDTTVLLDNNTKGIVVAETLNVNNSVILDTNNTNQGIEYEVTDDGEIHVYPNSVVSVSIVQGEENNEIKSTAGNQITYVVGGSLQGIRDNMTGDYSTAWNTVKGTDEIYAAPINNEGIKLTRFDLHNEVNKEVGLQSKQAKQIDKSFTYYNPNTNNKNYNYQFRFNNEGEDLIAGESGNAYVWTPASVLHYDATEGTIDKLGTAGEITVGNSMTNQTSENTGLNTRYTQDVTIYGNSLDLAEKTMPTATREGYVFAGWFVADNEDDAKTYAAAGNFTELYKLLNTEFTPASKVAEDITDIATAQADKTIYAKWKKPTPPIDPTDPEKPTNPDPVDPPEEEITDPDVPLVEPEDPTTEIDEPDVPLIDVPGTPVEEIDEPEVPLGDAPKTGDAAPIVGLVGLLVAAVAGLVVVRRKFN